MGPGTGLLSGRDVARLVNQRGRTHTSLSAAGTLFHRLRKVGQALSVFLHIELIASVRCQRASPSFTKQHGGAFLPGHGSEAGTSRRHVGEGSVMSLQLTRRPGNRHGCGHVVTLGQVPALNSLQSDIWQRQKKVFIYFDNLYTTFQPSKMN